MSTVEQLREHDTLTGRRLDDYLLCERLATGGLTEVYRALEQPSWREVAIKTVSITRPGPPDLAARFRLEAQRLAAFRHRHIVPLYAFREVDDLLYFAMPLLPGSLRDLIEAEGRLHPMQAARLAMQVASALSAAHARGIVHRDIKPENILIDGDGSALLTDFGIARDLAALQLEDVTWTLSSIGLPVGTPEYMPPEQLRGDPADQRVDVYGLGAVLYETLTGQAPHEGATPWAVAAQALMKEITPPSALAPDIWPALERLVLSALARSPHARPADMLTFEEALRDALGVMEARWEIYCDGKLAWVGSPGVGGPTRETRELHRSTPCVSTVSGESVFDETRDGKGTLQPGRRIGSSAILHLAFRSWRAVDGIVRRMGSNVVTAAALSWQIAPPAYLARQDFLRQMLRRWTRSSVRRSCQIGLLAPPIQRR